MRFQVAVIRIHQSVTSWLVLFHLHLSISCAHIYLRQVPNIIFHLWIFQYVLLEDKTQKHITIITRIKKLSTISVRYLFSGQVFNCLLNISLYISICIYLCICLCIKVYMYLSLYPFISQLFSIRIKMKATLLNSWYVF